MENEYYKIKEEKEGFLGERYFQLAFNTEKVLQVCVCPGEMKKGRTNNIGITIINRLTFISNYLSMKYVERIDKEEFRQQYERMTYLLKSWVS